MVIGWHESRTGALGRDIPHDHWLGIAHQVKKRVKVPLAFGPRLADPLIAEQALAEGLIDFWEICRPGLADPAILRKTAENRVAEIKPCIGDLTCLARLFANLPYICTVNPVLGHEIEPEYRITPAVRQKKVVVVGGGLSGLECAVTSVQRGHEVIIYERKEQLGGQVRSALREVKGGEDLINLIEYYKTQVNRCGIKVNLRTEFDRQCCTAEKPDVIVVAAGADIMRPEIPGIEKGLVSMAFEVLEKGVQTSGKRVVVIEGGKVGLITAEHFAAQGNSTWIITGDRRVDSDVSATFKWRHAAWVKEFGINVLTQSNVIEVRDDGVMVRDEKGKCSMIQADMVIIAGPRVSNQRLFAELEYLTDEIYIVGDSISPRTMTNAIHEGYRLGVRI
jgi:2,4-dienoyl-CoA reductase (NADPH2)